MLFYYYKRWLLTKRIFYYFQGQFSRFEAINSYFPAFGLNMEKKYQNNSEYGHFSRSGTFPTSFAIQILLWNGLYCFVNGNIKWLEYCVVQQRHHQIYCKQLFQHKIIITFKEAAKFYFIHYSRVVFILFGTRL